ncbi:hypothetical protein FKM82_018335 [Ascaphus truei]
MQVLMNKGIFITGSGRLPLAAVSSAAHSFTALSFRRLCPPNGVGSPLPSGRSPPVPGRWTQCRHSLCACQSTAADLDFLN